MNRLALSLVLFFLLNVCILGHSYPGLVATGEYKNQEEHGLWTFRYNDSIVGTCEYVNGRVKEGRLVDGTSCKLFAKELTRVTYKNFKAVEYEGLHIDKFMLKRFIKVQIVPYLHDALKEIRNGILRVYINQNQDTFITDSHSKSLKMTPRQYAEKERWNGQDPTRIVFKQSALIKEKYGWDAHTKPFTKWEQYDGKNWSPVRDGDFTEDRIEILQPKDHTGPWKQYFRSKRLWKDQNYHNGKLNGKSNVYFENGKIEKSTEYTNGNHDTYSREYYPNGITKEVFTIDRTNGKGQEIEYYSTGKIHKTSIFKSGYENRIVSYYDKQSSLYRISNYKDNMLQGKCVAFFNNGLTQEISIYEKDNLIKCDQWHGNSVKAFSGSKRRYDYWYNTGIKKKVIIFYDNHGTKMVQTFHINGKIHSISEYNNWGINGDSSVWSITGQQDYYGQYKDGHRHGLSKWWSNGILYIKCYFNMSKLDDKYFVFHDNGMPYIIGEYKNGLPVGTWETWNENGKLIHIRDTALEKIKHSKSNNPTAD